MKRITIIILSLFAVMQAQAQFSINYTFGYGTYDMGDMKQLLHNIEMGEAAQLYGLKNTANFPGYITHRLDVGYIIDTHEFGISSSFLTTGGKLSIADYSGEIASKITTNGFREGLLYRNYFYTSEFSNGQSLSFFGEISPAVMITHLKVQDMARAGTEKQENTYSLTKIGFSILPQVGLRYSINSLIGLHLSAGYELTTNTKVKELTSPNNVNWSGLRVGAGVGFRF